MIDIRSLRLGCEYQPLVKADTRETVGYEALARFTGENGEKIAPDIVFEHIHVTHALLGQIEQQAKEFQLNWAPMGHMLFINLDPHAVTPENKQQLFNMLSANPLVTVEIIENTCVNDANKAVTLVQELNQLAIPTALDDVGAPNTMLSLELLGQVNSIKFDLSWLSRIHIPHHRHMLQSLIQFAKLSGKTTILEGVEHEAQYQLAQQLGIDLVQGFLFKDRFITPPKTIPLVFDQALFSEPDCLMMPQQLLS